jgi:hypothetical protein
MALIAAGAFLLAVSERWLAPRVVASRSDSGEAQWIWAAPDRHGVTPLAFHLARDFELATRPGEAEVRLLADEEYVLYLNGVRVGGNRYRDGAALDHYQVGPLLVAGPNRLLVEVRSGRRAGGLLLRLTGGGGLEIVTGPEWSVLLRHRERHLDPGNALEQARSPRVWGGPPTGRWRLPEAGASLPLYADLLASGSRRRPERVRVGDDWRPPAQLRPKSPTLGQVVTFDWGREVTGYLGLFFGTRLWPKALLYFGCESVDPEAAPADQALGIRGRLQWTAARPQRFRCVTVVAPEGVRGAFVVEVEESRAEALLTGSKPVEGVFGLDDPPPLVTPVEHEIRRELEGLPGLVGGQPG